MKTPLRNAWQNMKTRCYNNNVDCFHNYGGRGIIVCKRWRESLADFCSDMGPTWRAGLTLDRTDNDGNYEPSNCRWATRKEQRGNQRSIRTVSSPWGVVPLLEASRLSGIPYQTLYRRIYRGGRRVFAPVRKKFDR